MTFEKRWGSVPAGMTLDKAGRLSGTPTQAGDFTFKVHAQDEAGNFAWGTFGLYIAEKGGRNWCDLVPTSLMATPTSPVAGGLVTVSYAVQNQGNGSTNKIRIGVVGSENGQFDSRNGRIFKTGGPISLKSQQQLVGSTTLQLPLYLKPGQSYYIGLLGDLFDDQLETNSSGASAESNNILSKTLTIASGQAQYRVTAPANGDTLHTGDNMIMWAGFPGNVDIALFNNQTLIEYIVRNTVNDGSHVWKVPAKYDGPGYQIRVSSATDSNIFSYSGVFSILSGANPIVTTGPATQVTSTTATLGGTVNPNGLATSYWFEHGSSTGYGNWTAVQLAGSGKGDKNVTANLTGLSGNATYHYRLAASNSAGPSWGEDKTLVLGSDYTLTLEVGGVATADKYQLPTTVSYNGKNLGNLLENGKVAGYKITTLKVDTSDLASTNTVGICPGKHEQRADLYDDVQVRSIRLVDGQGRTVASDNTTYHLGDNTRSDIETMYRIGRWADPNPPPWWDDLCGLNLTVSLSRDDATGFNMVEATGSCSPPPPPPSYDIRGDWTIDFSGVNARNFEFSGGSSKSGSCRAPTGNCDVATGPWSRDRSSVVFSISTTCQKYRDVEDFIGLVSSSNSMSGSVTTYHYDLVTGKLLPGFPKYYEWEGARRLATAQSASTTARRSRVAHSAPEACAE